MTIQDQFAGQTTPAPFDVLNAFPHGVNRRRHARRDKHPTLKWTVKRALDLAIAVPAVLLLCPLFALLTLAVAADSRGPILFCQKRRGLNGRPFGIYKFRTMRVLEDGVVITQAQERDLRVTRLGQFLRRTSLDELPQLFNVILGEMSLVGPRPHAIAHDDHYGALIPDYASRQCVKPGITGLAQISGYRGPTPTTACMAARVALDLDYARRQSLVLDLTILLRTPLAVLFQRNAI